MNTHKESRKDKKITAKINKLKIHIVHNVIPGNKDYPTYEYNLNDIGHKINQIIDYLNDIKCSHGVCPICGKNL